MLGITGALLGKVLIDNESLQQPVSQISKACRDLLAFDSMLSLYNFPGNTWFPSQMKNLEAD